jgi:hypothetical protein
VANSVDDEKEEGRKGRPSKALLEQTKKPGRVGRPKGQTAILKDYRARMLASPKSRKVLTKILDTALEDGHPHQGVCMKIVADRILNMSHFQKEQASSANEVKITINVAENSTAHVGSGEAIDADFEEVEEVGEVEDQEVGGGEAEGEVGGRGEVGGAE